MDAATWKAGVPVGKKQGVFWFGIPSSQVQHLPAVESLLCRWDFFLPWENWPSSNIAEPEEPNPSTVATHDCSARISAIVFKCRLI